MFFSTDHDLYSHLESQFQEHLSGRLETADLLAIPADRREPSGWQAVGKRAARAQQ